MQWLRGWGWCGRRRREVTGVGLKNTHLLTAADASQEVLYSRIQENRILTNELRRAVSWMTRDTHVITSAAPTDDPPPPLETDSNLSTALASLTRSILFRYCREHLADWQITRCVSSEKWIGIHSSLTDVLLPRLLDFTTRLFHVKQFSQNNSVFSTNRKLIYSYDINKTFFYLKRWW